MTVASKKARPRKRPVRVDVSNGRRPAVFLDRDGTICEEVGYINHLDRLQLFPWTAGAIRRLNSAALPVIAVTNQSGVARGIIPEELVHRVHQKIALELAAQDAKIDAVYYCPHHPEAPLDQYRTACRCRKPGTGMMEEAAKRLRLDLKSSYVVGDSYRDVQMGHNAGARSILVMTGYGRGEYEHQRHKWPKMPDRIAENLQEAVDIILREFGRSGGKARSASRGQRAP